MDLTPTLLTELRAMHAVAQTGSFAAAAAELFVTPSAVSHHVRRLERALGTTLFHRSSHGVVISDEARDLVDACSRGFDAIDASVKRVRSAAHDDTTITITVAPYFSAQWLTPRLGRLRRDHPDLSLRLHHAYEPVDFASDDADVGLVWGSGTWPAVTSTLVVKGDLVAVCSRELRARLPSPLRPADIAGHSLLYEFDAAHWQLWFAAMGATLPEGAQCTRIDDSHALRTAAIDGQGIALFFRHLIEADLAHGLLVTVLDHTIDTGNDYYLTVPANRAPRPAVRTFARWIMREAGA